MAHGQITHIEIPADDVERARRFYRELFGWQTGEIEGMPGYFLFSFGEIKSAGGAIGKRGIDIAEQVRNYIEVDAIDPVLARVPALGGTVKTPRTEIPGQGWFAVIDDSEGNELGLFEVGQRQE
jgi:predicted enzyme related to lactoylglutathione lyase